MSVKSRLKNEAQALRESGVSLKGADETDDAVVLAMHTDFFFLFFLYE